MRLLFVAASIFNDKARRDLRGTKNLFVDLEKILSRLPVDNRTWFHVSSLGEFEQAELIIEILKQSGYKIIASFFSP